MAQYAWRSCEFTITPEGAAETIVRPVRSVDYDDTMSHENVMGAGDEVLDVSDGQYTPGGMTIVMLSKYARELMAAVTANGARPLSSVPMRLTVKKAARGDAAPLVDVVDFLITGASDSHAQGSGAPLETTFTCLPQKITRNGVRL